MKIYLKLLVVVLAFIIFSIPVLAMNLSDVADPQEESKSTKIPPLHDVANDPFPSDLLLHMANLIRADYPNLFFLHNDSATWLQVNSVKSLFFNLRSTCLHLKSAINPYFKELPTALKISPKTDISHPHLVSVVHFNLNSLSSDEVRAQCSLFSSPNNPFKNLVSVSFNQHSMRKLTESDLDSFAAMLSTHAKNIKYLTINLALEGINGKMLGRLLSKLENLESLHVKMGKMDIMARVGLINTFVDLQNLKNIHLSEAQNDLECKIMTMVLLRKNSLPNLNKIFIESMKNSSNYSCGNYINPMTVKLGNNFICLPNFPRDVKKEFKAAIEKHSNSKTLEWMCDFYNS